MRVREEKMKRGKTLKNEAVRREKADSKEKRKQKYSSGQEECLLPPLP